MASWSYSPGAKLSELCLDLIFVASPCEKMIIVPGTNYITSAITKFMLDMPSPGSFKSEPNN